MMIAIDKLIMNHKYLFRNMKTTCVFYVKDIFRKCKKG